MCEPFLLDLSGHGVEHSDLLKLGMEIYSYNDHRSAPFSRACWLVLAPPTYSGMGADIVMESITLRAQSGLMAIIFERPHLKLVEGKNPISLWTSSRSKLHIRI